MKLTPHIHLSFNGTCEAAFAFYASHLNGQIESSFTYGGSPAAATAPPGWDDKIMHATLRIGDTLFMGADVAPESFEPARGFSLTLNVDSPTDAERLFQALAEGGTIGMPMQETFWAARFGTLVDRFGIPWSINADNAPAASA